MKNNDLEKVYNLYAKQIYLYACSLCRNHYLAEELVSDTFYKALLSFDGKSDDIKYWLIRVCRNLFIDQCRKNKKNMVDFDEKIIVQIDYLEERILKSEENKRLYQALLKLSVNDREIVTMYYFMDCNISMIAKQTRKKQGAVKTSLSRARVKLRKILEEDYNE